MTKITLLLAAAAFAGAVAAEGGAKADAKAPDEHAAVQAQFQAADANKDGVVDATELAAVADEAAKAKLTAADANKDGKIEAAELKGEKKEKGEKKDKAEKKAEGEKKAE